MFYSTRDHVFFRKDQRLGSAFSLLAPTHSPYCHSLSMRTRASSMNPTKTEKKERKRVDSRHCSIRPKSMWHRPSVGCVLRVETFQDCRGMLPHHPFHPPSPPFANDECLREKISV